MCPHLSGDEKRSLLLIARTSIEAALTGNPQSEAFTGIGNLAARRGAFVTLHHRGRLRGCIGRVAVLDPVFIVVAECAASAATEDPRFPSLRREELVELEIEISVLSVPKHIPAEDVQVGIHGVIVSRGVRRGVLLPQVAAQHAWSREHFLEQVCHKAGLEADAWKSPETCIEVFTAEVFSESDLRDTQKSDSILDVDAGSYSSSQ